MCKREVVAARYVGCANECVYWRLLFRALFTSSTLNLITLAIHKLLINPILHIYTTHLTMQVANFVLKILRFLFLMLHWEYDKSVIEVKGDFTDDSNGIN